MQAEMLKTLDEILHNASRLASKVSADQWTAQTPCAEWDARALINHMAGTCVVMGMVASRQTPTSTPNDDHVGDDPVGGLEAAARDNFAAWSADGALDGMISIPAEMPALAGLGVTILDVGTHCWDLAHAIGIDHGLSDENIAMIDHWNRQIVSADDRSGEGFGPVLEPTDDDALTQMLAYVSRRR
jgi:uncharacterized protein (TIGR03086 family)